MYMYKLPSSCVSPLPIPTLLTMAALSLLYSSRGQTADSPNIV